MDFAVSERVTSVEAIVQASLQIIDREGLQALSMRRLAESLGVGAMSLYRYVKTKDELLDLILTQVFRDLDKEASKAAGPWHVRLSEMMRQLRDVLRRHPDIAALSMARTPVSAFDPYRELIMSTLMSAGFSAPEAFDHLGSLFAYVTGHNAIERVRSMPGVEREQVRLASLPKERFPHLAQVGEYFSRHSPHHNGPYTNFDVGLSNLIDAIARSAPAPPQH